MNIRLEDIDIVRERTDANYTQALEALEKCGGDVVKAIVYIESGGKNDPGLEQSFNNIIEKVISAIKEGNVNKVEMLKDEKIVLSVPVNVGIVGGIIGMSFIPWALIPAFLAVYTMGCKFRITRDDDSSEDIE